MLVCHTASWLKLASFAPEAVRADGVDGRPRVGESTAGESWIAPRGRRLYCSRVDGVDAPASSRRGRRAGALLQRRAVLKSRGVARGRRTVRRARVRVTLILNYAGQRLCQNVVNVD